MKVSVTKTHKITYYATAAHAVFKCLIILENLHK